LATVDRIMRPHRRVRWRVILVLVVAASSVALAAPVDPSLDGIVAVGRANGKIVLATLAKPVERLEWRFREIPISPDSTVVADVDLSGDATKALVSFADGPPQVLDLTERITGISFAETAAAQHSSPGQLFPYASNGKVCLLDDLATPREGTCRDAVAASIRKDGRALYVYRDGRMAIVSLAAASADAGEELLPYRVPAGDAFHLLAGQPGDAHDFLVVVSEHNVISKHNADSTETVKSTQAVTAQFTTKIIDPDQPDVVLGQSSDPVLAELMAALDFSPAASAAPTSPEVLGSSESTLAILVEHLRTESGSPQLAWSFQRVTANPELYAPILEFAAHEPAYPSDVDIWQEITPLTHGTSRADYQAAYASLGDRRWSRCTSYVRTLSYPGTWLIEYWFYYPFDEGRSHPHLHDSEHMFIEVDKLGGTVRKVFAADHDTFVGNNLYSASVKDARPVQLPIFATVELGKHAMAPDLNHDGRFERNVDDNLHPENYSVWGVRDRSSKVHFMMEPYLSYMTLPRDRDDRFALMDEDALFPGIDVPSEHLVCKLQPFPVDPPCRNCEGPTAEAGVEQLERHADALNPEAIYKPYVAPWREVRVGVGIYDWSEVRGEFTLSLIGDFRHMTGGLLHIPAQLEIESGWRPWKATIPVPLAGQNQFVQSYQTLYAGAGVQRLITNTQGFYFETTPRWVNIAEHSFNGSVVPSDTHWQWGGVSYHLGYVLELPSAHKGNFTNYLGVVIRNAPDYPILFEWRVSLGFLRQRGRHDFGAHASDRNPYE
jgi:hypothetical protein